MDVLHLDSMKGLSRTVKRLWTYVRELCRWTRLFHDVGCCVCCRIMGCHVSVTVRALLLRVCFRSSEVVTDLRSG